MDLIPLLLRLFCILKVFASVQGIETRYLEVRPGDADFIPHLCYNFGFCNKQNFKVIPQYLHKDIKMLYLHFNHIEEIEKHTFKRYSKLEDIILSYNFIATIDPDSFTSLTKLNRLDLSKNNLKTFKQRLPPLRFLDLSHNPLQEFSVAGSKIYEINLNSTKVSQFPTIEKGYTVSRLSLSSTAIENVSADDIVLYCQLEYFGVSTDRNIAPDHCSCARFRFWMLSVAAKPYRELFVVANNSSELTINHPLYTACDTVENCVYCGCENGNLQYSKKIVQQINHCVKKVKTGRRKEFISKLRPLYDYDWGNDTAVNRHNFVLQFYGNSTVEQ